MHVVRLPPFYSRWMIQLRPFKSPNPNKLRTSPPEKPKTKSIFVP